MSYIPTSKKLLPLLLLAVVVLLTLLHACGTGGSVASTSSTPADPQTPVAPQTNTYVYVTTLVEGLNQSGTYYPGSGGISAFQMDSNGTLRKNVPGSPVLFDSNMPSALAADPLGRFLFAASPTNIFTFRIAPSTGELTRLANTTLPPTSNTSYAGGPMAVDHAGNFLYALALNGLNVYSIASSGTLTSVQTITTPVDLRNGGIALDSAGKYLYAVTTGNSIGIGVNSPTVYSVDSTSGKLTMVSSFPAYQYGTGALAVNPNGSSVYVLTASPLSNLVFENSNGSLTQVQSTGCGCDPDNEGNFVLVHPSGKFLYETVSNEVIGMTINSDGSLGKAISPFVGFPLTPTPGAQVAIGSDPGGNFLLASQSLPSGPNATPVVTEFAVDATTGNLKQISVSPFMLDVPSSDPFATVVVSVPQ